MDKETKRILVLGDEFVDWHLVQATKSGSSCWLQPGGFLAPLPGGAHLLISLIEECLDYQVVSQSGKNITTEPSGKLLIGRNVSQTMALSSMFAREPKSKERTLRIESLCGVSKHAGSLVSTEGKITPKPFAVLLDDSGLALRDDVPHIVQAIEALMTPTNNQQPWIILKVVWPVLDSPVLSELAKRVGERLIVIVPIEDLRRDRIQVSRGLSWEQTAQDLAWEFNYNPRFKVLGSVHSLIVSLGLEGVWFSLPSLPHDNNVKDVSYSTLVYDPNAIEGSWGKDRPGMCLGYTSCLTIGILAKLSNGDESSLTRGAQSGLSAMRALHTAGYQVDGDKGCISLPSKEIRTAVEKPHTFPYSRVPLGYRHYSVPLENSVTFAEPERWSILREIASSSSHLLDLAIRIVREGADRSLGAIPHARFGELLTVDRNEIEAFRATYDLIQEYCHNVSLHRPLSIAVFGPPGSGKSFGVSQVAKTVAGSLVEKITFNVSQFTDDSDLANAFHRVRDIGLRGKLPLVFWDEFDSNFRSLKLYWLKSFLAPMQDGEFTQGQITHPIGRAVFVFAGGTAPSVNDLGANLSPDDQKSAKVPDFKSRLRGCINIVGIDRIHHDRNTHEQRFDIDAQYVIRRAVILRTIIEIARPDVIESDGIANIDQGLLKALLFVWSFRHGVRSLESIIQLCHMGDPGVLHRSSLPPAEVLSLHVNTTQFLGLITADVEFTGATLEKLASAHHELYRETSTSSPLAKMKYEELSTNDKEKNRDAVRGIPYKLAAIGFTYQTIRVPRIATCDSFTDEEAEKLARMEHNRWILAAMDNGYIYGEHRDDNSTPKTHPDLVPWDEMDDQTLATVYHKNVASRLGNGPLLNSIDLDMARNIPEIMQRAGYSVRRL